MIRGTMRLRHIELIQAILATGSLTHRNVDACETTLNPGAQVGTLENHRASRCKADLHSRRCRAPGVANRPSQS